MELLLVVVALLLQAGLAASEGSLIRANWIRLRTWAADGRAWAGQALSFLERKESALVTALVGTNLALIASSTLAERYVIYALGTEFTVLSVGAVTAASLVFGTFIPKALAQAQPESWLLLLTPLLRGAELVLRPISWPLAQLSGLGKRQGLGLSLTRGEVMFALRTSTGRPGSGPQLGGIAARVLEFRELQVKDVMTPLGRVVMIPEGLDSAGLSRKFAEHSYTRLPVYHREPSSIIGIVSMRDLLYTGEVNIRPAMYVRTMDRALEVMNRMRAARAVMAVVTETDGRAVGIVTLEDLLEEMVGEIRDEG